MRHTPTIISTMTNALARYAGARIERRYLLRAAGLDEEGLARRGARIPQRADLAMWVEAERLLGDQDIGLSFAESEENASALGLVGLMVMTSESIGLGIERMVRYHQLIQDGNDVRLTKLEGGMMIEKSPRLPDVRVRAAYSMASFVTLARRWTGELVRPKEVFFMHARPARTSAYERIFGCPIRFGHRSNGILFDREVLSLPFRTAQPDVVDFLESQARVALESMPNDVVSAARVVVEEGLARGDVQLPHIARRLGMSVRTLQRRLGERGIVYEALVDEVRRAKGIPLVIHSDLPLAVVSERLGYSETKAFRRAFRRWTGMAPAEARQRSA
ncbi:AraC family transcriptional regulator [Sorangium sp. So ce1000]|uniref:AraC family transcriptional regulator n=1 Tax=Sorangium sp. So ce1000 TaxID=3133325 RepID=UPI003F619EA0